MTRPTPAVYPRARQAATPDAQASAQSQPASQAWRPPMPEPLVVRRETHIAAPPAAVFALLTDPEKILRWMGTEAQMEPRPGGLYLVNVTGARCARGSFREVVPVHRLAYSFGWDGSEVVPPGSSLGVNTSIFSPSGGSVGIGFAIPADTARLVVAQLKDHGHVTRGWLGVHIQPVT